MKTTLLATTILAAFCAASHGQTFVDPNGYTINSAEFGNWQMAAMANGAVSFTTEDFDSYTSNDPDLDIPPGTTLTTPAGLTIAFDETPDASVASRAEIDRVNTSWSNDPSFEGTASFEGFKLVPGGNNAVGKNSIAFLFPEPVIGFAGDFESPTSGGDLTLVIDGVSVAALEPGLPEGTDGFFGYVHNTPFTSISFGAENQSFAGEVFDIDNATWATVVPEPSSTLAAMMAALIILLRAPNRMA